MFDLDSLQIPEVLKEDLLIQEKIFGYNEDKIESGDCDWIAYNLVRFARIRPFDLDYLTKLCLKYGTDSSFDAEIQKYILKRGLVKCPKIIHCLYCKGLFSFEDIKRELEKSNNFMPYFYFFNHFDNLRTQIERFWKYSECRSNFKLLETQGSDFFYQLIKYGCPVDSIQYYLKYDDVDGLSRIVSNPGFNHNSPIKFSSFEWAYSRIKLNSLGFAAYFGSIKCFKKLIMDSCSVIVPITRNLEILHICDQIGIPKSQDLMRNAAILYDKDLLQWLYDPNCNDELILVTYLRAFILLINNGLDISFTKDECYFIIMVTL